MVLAFKAVNGTAPIYLQTLIRPHTLVREPHSAKSVGQLLPPPLRANKGRLSGGTNSQPMSGQQSHSPSSAKDSRLTCSDFTLTPHTMIFVTSV